MIIRLFVLSYLILILLNTRHSKSIDVVYYTNKYMYLRQRKRQKLGKLETVVILSARTGKTLPSQNTIVPNREQPT